MEEVRRAHVIPIGLEVDRILAGFKEYPANYAIFVKSKKIGSDVEKIARENAESVKEKIKYTAEVEDIELDYHDFKTSFVEFKKLFEVLQDRGYSVYVNLSSGTRIVASAALIASFLSGARPYYVVPKKYNYPKEKTVLSEGAEKVLTIPTLDVTLPSDEEIKILQALSEAGGRVSKQVDLIPFLEGKELFPDQKFMEDEVGYLKRKKAKLSRHLGEMVDKGFVKLSGNGKYTSVELTASGELFSLA